MVHHLCTASAVLKQHLVFFLWSLHFVPPSFSQGAFGVFVVHLCRFARWETNWTAVHLHCLQKSVHTVVLPKWLL